MRQRPLPIGVHILLVLLAPGMSSEGAERDAAVRATVEWKPEQIRLNAHDEHPWWTFPVTARFTHQATGRGLVLEGYWDGDKEWVVRFAAPLPGTWNWETSSSDEGLDGHRGRLEVRRPTEEEIAGNPNYRGQLEISENGRHFQYADGTPRFLLADTLWAGNTARCGLGSDTDGPFFEYLDDRKAKGFNAILIKYLHGFGDIANNPSGDRNEGGYAFLTRDFRRLNPGYFRALDRRLGAIWEHGLVAAVPTAWWGKTKRCAFDIRWARRISAYCAVRCGAYNSLWCLSGEYQYAFRDCGWTPEQFDDLGTTVQAHNPYRHPLSIHPSSRTDWPAPHNCQSSRPFHQSPWLDHHWLQTGQSVDRMVNIVRRAEENLGLKPVRPVFCSEGYYDVADDLDQAYHARWQAWVALLSGCAGYGHGAHGIWQFYDPGDEKGETGKEDKRAVPWSEALRLDGSGMMRPVAAMLAACPWWRLEPGRDRVLVDGKANSIPTAEDLRPPHCAVVPGRFCLVYVPRGNQQRLLTLVGLEGHRYRAGWFNPRNGRAIAMAEGPSGHDEWTIPNRPEPREEDWVLILNDASRAFPTPEQRNSRG